LGGCFSAELENNSVRDTECPVVSVSVNSGTRCPILGAAADSNGMCRALQKKNIAPARNNMENVAATLAESFPLYAVDCPNTRHRPKRTTRKPKRESRRLIHGTGAAGKPRNGNPLLRAPSTVNNNPVHGLRVRFRCVVSTIAVECSTGST
jgi:hypothetical protein